MNKQELIEKLTEYFEYYEGDEDRYIQGKYSAYRVALNLAKQLDKPQKPVIQQFVADLVDWTNKMQCAPSDVIRDLHDNGDLANLPRDLELDKLSEYFEKAYCRYDFEKACFVGYEVEKEPLYCVKIGKGYFSGFDETKVTYVIDDAPGALAQRVKYETREEAEMDAIQIGGTVEEVAE